MNRLLNTLFFVMAVGNLILLSVLLYTYDKWYPGPLPRVSSEYSRGVHNASDCLMLLDLENSLTGKRMMWGEMKATCEDRLGVKP